MIVRKRRLPAALLISLALAGSPVPGKTDLPDRFKKWLDEEVAYIISPLEREVFLKLQADRERDLFIEAFWKHRDPTPDSAENEFKTEHYRRISYADRYLGRDSTKPGWKTDRGRIYVILGEPNDITRYQSKTDVYDSEIWFYQGKPETGLPAGFNILFFKPNNTGEFRLYSPVSDGPAALLPGYYASAADYAEAYEKLFQADPTLAGVSMSLIPGEQSGVYGRPSLVSDLLLQKIETAPFKTVEEKYARKFLEYKDVVEVEYSTNYVDSDALVKVLRDPSGMPFVHYMIELKKLAVGGYGKKFYASMKLNGTVTTPDGRLVHQFDKTVAVDMDEVQLNERSHAPLDILDAFPIVPGDYKLSVLLKNEVSKEFTSLEQAIRVPVPGPGSRMTAPILAYEAKAADPAAKKIRPFRMGAHSLLCQPGRVFLKSDTLTLAFQLEGLSGEAGRSAEIRYAFFRDDQPFKEIVRKTADIPGLPDVVEAVPLAEFPPAHYRVRIAVASGGTEVVSAIDEFDVTHLETIPRPWLYVRLLPEPGDPVYGAIVGLQLFNLGRFDEARALLEASFRKKPEEDTALTLGRIYYREGRYADIGPLLAPFLAGPKPAKYDAYLLAAGACQAGGEFGRAIEIYDAAVAHYGVTTAVLNPIGECYYGMGKLAEARAVWEKSLSMNSDQPEIRKLVEKTKSRN